MSATAFQRMRRRHIQRKETREQEPLEGIQPQETEKPKKKTSGKKEVGKQHG